MILKELYEAAENMLREAGIEACKFETDCLFEDILGTGKLDLMLNGGRAVPKQNTDKLFAAAEKRCSVYPLQYILGKWEFFGRPFYVGEGVLIPRPDTETLIEKVLEHFAVEKNDSPEICDLCSGSGCIAVTLKKELPKAVVHAVELSSEAMPYLIKNITLNCADVKIIKGDVTDENIIDNFADTEDIGEYRKIDAIVSNPPYLTDREMTELSLEVKCEPELALKGGKDGLYFYRIITEKWKKILADGGLIAFEIGYEQGEAVSGILKENGCKNIAVHKDLCGNDRVVTGIK